MSANSPHPVSRPTRGARSGRGTGWAVLALQLVLLTLGVVALVAQPRLQGDQRALAQVVAPAASGAVLVVGLLMLVPPLSGRRRRARTKQTLAWIEDLHLCSAPTQNRTSEPPAAEVESLPTAAGGGTETSRRVLELQVRSLEAALDEEQQRSEDIRRTIEGQLTVAGRHDQERILLAVQALRPSLVHETGAVAVDRILAVLGRLGAAPSFIRPPLPAGSAGGRSVTLSAAPAAMPPTPKPPAPEPPAPEPAPPVATAPTDEAAQPAEEGGQDLSPHVAEPAPAADRPADTRPVLPVPAPRNVSSTSRPRRRLRRTVDA